MSVNVNVPRLEHSPTLNTMLMVEHTLKEMDESVVSVADLKKKLPRQVNHNTLKRGVHNFTCV